MSGDQVRIFNAVIEEDRKNLSGLPVGDVRPLFPYNEPGAYYHGIHRVGLFSNTVTSSHCAQL